MFTLLLSWPETKRIESRRDGTDYSHSSLHGSLLKKLKNVQNKSDVLLPVICVAESLEPANGKNDTIVCGQTDLPFGDMGCLSARICLSATDLPCGDMGCLPARICLSATWVAFRRGFAIRRRICLAATWVAFRRGFCLAATLVAFRRGFALRRHGLYSGGDQLTERKARAWCRVVRMDLGSISWRSVMRSSCTVAVIG